MGGGWVFQHDNDPKLEIDRYIGLPIFKHFNVFSVFDPSKYTHLEQWTHTHTHTHLEQWTHTHTHTHTWSSGHTHTHTHLEQWTHTHLEQWTHTHTHTPGAVDTHTHTHLEQWTHTHTHTPGAVDTVHSGEAPARPPHVTLYKIHSFETH